MWWRVVQYLVALAVACIPTQPALAAPEQSEARILFEQGRSVAGERSRRAAAHTREAGPSVRERLKAAGPCRRQS